jgi:biotin carboxyl carrier protein
MKVEIQIGERKRVVEIERQDERWRWRLDGQDVAADAVEVVAGTYSILIGGQAFEARVEARGAGLLVHVGSQEFAAVVVDPRQWRRRRGAAALASEGRQLLAAPMPGKVVRLLVSPGDRVEAGQGVLVVEAMKMQNEIRSPKRGSVERLMVAEGQAINTGDVLIVIS